MTSGSIFIRNTDDVSAKTEALRFGVLEILEKNKKEHTPRPDMGSTATIMVKENDWYRAFILFYGYKNPDDNGYAVLSIAPASKENLAFLVDEISYGTVNMEMALIDKTPKQS
jgi:hypothetical protein